MRRAPVLLGAILAAVMGGISCEFDPAVLLPPRESLPPEGTPLTLVARIAHVTDTHVIDEESPARFAGAQVFTDTAWRPWESTSTQIFDGIIRTVNRIHASGRSIDFLLHTGDGCDNVQSNELGWLLGVMDGEMINPLTGPDDRPAEARPEPLLDPHAAFQAQGLYRAGVHGDLPSIPWYVLVGNHEAYALGLFPICTDLLGHRYAPLPLDDRLGIVLPTFFDPTGWLAHGNVTPASPGPPNLLEIPSFVAPVEARRYFTRQEFVRSMFDTVTGPAGHGFEDPQTGSTCYSVSPVAGLRLIALDTCDQPQQVPGSVYDHGGISLAQRTFLRSELDAAADRGEIVVVASHHPSSSLSLLYATAVAPDGLREMLNQYPNVVLHLAGHLHRNRVADRGGYLEIETCSTIDPPQEGRLIEIWRDEADGSIVISYEMFSHVDDTWPPLGDDPLRTLREQARAIAAEDASVADRQKRFDPDEQADPVGSPSDRAGTIRKGPVVFH